MSAEALRTGESKGSPIHAMQRVEKSPSMEVCHSAVEFYSLILIFRH